MEQRSNFEGNRGIKTILGKREHKKTIFFIKVGPHHLFAFSSLFYSIILDTGK